jgi:NAD(P)-dependent dehydrogenase (short-subunit alcohol dehydrogenase family)
MTKFSYKASDLFDFSGVTALVVGGATGLGAEMASALLANGGTVAIASRDMSKVEAKAAQLNQSYDGRCIPLPVDLDDQESIQALCASLKSAFNGTLNIAINSAGFNVRNPIQDISLDEWENIQRTNITGAFLLSRELFPLLKEASWGRLIHITSIFSSRSFADRLSYATSKGALLQLVRTLALEWASLGITVNGISPGPFLTDINKPVLDNPENYKSFCNNIPIGRFGNPEEIVTTCLFLASQASSYVNAADIIIDGGWTAK